MKPTYEDLEAQCAAMREALEDHINYFGGLPHHPDDCPSDCDQCAVSGRANRALASYAGREMLERLRKVYERAEMAEAACLEWQNRVDAWAAERDEWKARAEKAEAESAHNFFEAQCVAKQARCEAYEDMIRKLINVQWSTWGKGVSGGLRMAIESVEKRAKEVCK